MMELHKTLHWAKSIGGMHSNPESELQQHGQTAHNLSSTSTLPLSLSLSLSLPLVLFLSVRLSVTLSLSGSEWLNILSSAAKPGTHFFRE